MVTVRIEHAVPNFDVWKQVFDSDPVGRETIGVRRYEVLRATDDSNVVMVDLDFDSQGAADTFLAAMQGIWRQAEGTIVHGVRARVVESVETKAFEQG